MSVRNGGDINQTHPKEPANNVFHVFKMISNEDYILIRDIHVLSCYIK